MEQGYAQHVTGGECRDQHVFGIHQRQKNGLVHLAARIGLNIGEFAAEQFGGAGNGQIFNHVGIFAAAIIAPAGITFGVFVGKD